MAKKTTVKKVVKKSAAKKVVKKTPKASAHPSFNPPTAYPVKNLGAVMQGRCDLRHPGCTADPAGIIRGYRNKTTQQQSNACKSCHDQMVLSGQWVDTP